MNNFTHDEITLTALYSDGTRAGTIKALTDMRGYLEPDEHELRGLTDAAVGKLEQLTEEDFDKLDLFPEFGEDGDGD